MNSHENKPKINNATLFVAALSVCLGFALLGVSPQVLAFQLDTTENVRLLRINRDGDFVFEEKDDDDLPSEENPFENTECPADKISPPNLQSRVEDIRAVRTSCKNTQKSFIDNALSDFLAPSFNFSATTLQIGESEIVFVKNSPAVSPEILHQSFAQRHLKTPVTRARGSI